MDEIENIIEKYKRELMEFALDNSSPVPQAVPTVAQMQPEEPMENTVVENPVPIVESETIGDFFPQYSSLDDFLSQNTEQGSLRVQVFAANRAFPISGARVSVFLPLAGNDRVDLFDGITDINGVIDGIILAAPSSANSQSPETANIRPFAAYTIFVEHPQFASAQFLNVPIFPRIKSIQNVELVPLIETGEAPPTNTRIGSEPYLNLRGGDENGTDNS